MAKLLNWGLAAKEEDWWVYFELEPGRLQHLLAVPFGCTVPVTNHENWTAAQVVRAYRVQHVEPALRGLQGKNQLGWVPIHQWADDQIEMHAFSRMLGNSLPQYSQRCADRV